VEETPEPFHGLFIKPVSNIRDKTHGGRKMLKVI
jgi:hypothetical protein